jgi:hypothetical protein
MIADVVFESVKAGIEGIFKVWLKAEARGLEVYK